MTGSKPSILRPTGTARILVIDDEGPIRHFLKIALASGGLDVVEAENGRKGIELAATATPDAIILDLGLPDIDGKDVIVAIREWSKAPLLVLSVRDGEAEKISALDAGADDYVTKPFSTGELMARLRVLLRNQGDRAADGAEITVGALTINFATRSVLVDDLDVSLTRKHFDVLAVLVRHAGRLVTHRHLLTTLWGPAHADDTHYLRIAIGHIRDRIGDDAANPRFIVTEPGVGYRLKGE